MGLGGNRRYRSPLWLGLPAGASARYSGIKLCMRFRVWSGFKNQKITIETVVGFQMCLAFRAGHLQSKLHSLLLHSPKPRLKSLNAETNHRSSSPQS